MQRNGFRKSWSVARGISRKTAEAPLFWYALLTLLIMAPLLVPGFVLTLDMVFTPEIRLPAQVTSSYGFYGLLHLLNIALPADFLQKVVLSATFVMMGLGVHKLIYAVDRWRGRVPHLSTLPLYLAGAFYTINPFTYERFITGQYAVLMGYALLPWLLRSLLGLLAKPDWGQMLRVTAWATALAIVSIHSILPAVLISVLFVILHLWRQRGQGRMQWQTIYFCGLVVLFWVAANCYWLAPLATGQSPTAQTIDSFTSGDRQAFATTGGNAVERIGNVLALQGFWGERYKLFVAVQEYVPAWGVLMAILVLVTIVCGGIMLWRWKQRGVLVVTGLAAILATIIAAGIGNEWLAAHIPLFAGYREPQKFAVVIALAYAIALAYGAAGLTRLVRKYSRLPITVPIVWIALFLLPALTGSAIFWGARGQLHATQYPDSWAKANRELNRDNRGGDYQSLFLPWHLYIYTDFVGRTIANPAVNYFDKPMIVSDDPELGGAALTKTDSTRRQINAALATAPRDRSGQELGLLLAQLNIKYIVVAHISDYPLYGYLNRQANISLQSDYGTLQVYRNDAFDELRRGRLYQPDESQSPGRSPGQATSQTPSQTY